MNGKIEKAERPSSVEITFGTLFKPIGREEAQPDRIDVVTDIGEGDIFHAVMVDQDKDGKFLQPSGTVRSKELGCVVGQMSIEEVIAAEELMWKKLGIGNLTAEQKDTRLKQAGKGSRTLILEQ